MQPKTMPTVTLDDKIVDYISVDIKPLSCSKFHSDREGVYVMPPWDYITLKLSDGTVIYDNGRRVKVIINKPSGEQ